jgi:uncharacterized protein with HEPN domain
LKRSQAKLLHDALSAGREIQEYTAGASYDQLLTDRSLQLILERLFEIVGEAISKADANDPSLREVLPDVRDIVGTRNRIAHGYWEVSYRVLWDAANQEIPALCDAVERMLEEGPIERD